MSQMSQNAIMNRGRTRARFGLVIGLMGTASLVGTAHAQNAVTDFNYLNASNAAGTIGTWTYGTVSNAAFTSGGYALTTYDATVQGAVSGNSSNDAGRNSSAAGNVIPIVDRNTTSSTITNGTNVLPTDHLFLQEGFNGEVSIVRFIAKNAGTYSFTGDFKALDTTGTTSQGTIKANASTANLFSAAISGAYNSTGSTDPFSLTSVPLSAGNYVDFIVSYGSANSSTNNDGSGLAATASFTAAAAPEPSALALIIPSLLGVVGVMRRRIL